MLSLCPTTARDLDRALDLSGLGASAVFEQAAVTPSLTSAFSGASSLSRPTPVSLSLSFG